MKYKLVIADVDGTLVAPSSDEAGEASPKLAKSVQKVQDMGVIFSVATARSLDKVEKLVKSLNINSPIILDNGARIYDCMVEKYIFNSYIPESKTKEVISVLDQFPYEKYIVDTKERHLYDPNIALKIKEVVKIIILHISPYEAQEVFETVSRIKDIKVTKSISGENPIKESIHITNIDTGKENGVRRIADLSGVNLNQVMGIGDSYNDFSMLTACGFKVAVGNAVDEIKSIADYIAPDYDKDGVVHVLKKFILNGNE